MLALIIAIALVYRLAFLFEPISGDEVGAALWHIRDSVPGIMTSYGMPKNHILQSLLSHIGFMVGGYSEFWIRLPVFAASLFNIPLVYILGKKVTENKYAGLLAALFMATSTYCVYYAGSARGYSIQITLALLLALLAFKDKLNPELAVLGLTIGSFLMLYNIPTAIIFLIPYYLWLLLRPTEVFRRSTTLAAGVLVCVMCALSYGPFIQEMRDFSNGGRGVTLFPSMVPIMQEVNEFLITGVFPDKVFWCLMLIGLIFMLEFRRAFHFSWMVLFGYIGALSIVFPYQPWLVFITRHYGVLFPFAFILLGLGIVRLYEGTNNYPTIRLYLLTFLISCFGLNLAHDVTAKAFERQEPLYRLRLDCRQMARLAGEYLKPGEYLRGLGTCDGIGQWYSQETARHKLEGRIDTMFVISGSFEEALAFYEAEIPKQAVTAPRAIARHGTALMTMMTVRSGQ